VARAVLGLRLGTGRAIVLIFAAFVAATSNAQPASSADCAPVGLAAVPAGRQGAVQEFERRVKLGPFYKELTRRFGIAEFCKVTLDDGSIGLSFTYHGDARLNATMETQIEFAEQRVQFSGLNAKSSIALLKKAEAYAFGTHGCGIEWKTPAETIAGERVGSREEVYRGDTCNCQARVIFEGSSVVGLVLRSAC
jgi:hypothetical protein